MAPRKRHPRFNGWVCLIDGCDRVDYKHGLCRKHWYEVPLVQRLDAMMAALHAQYEAKRKSDRWFAQWARNYETGMSASASRRAASDR